MKPSSVRSISKKSRNYSANTRKGARGAALVEATVAIPFLLLMFASIMFVGRLYEKKLMVMRTVKQSAWSYAMCNCGKSGDATSYTCRKVDKSPEARPGDPSSGGVPGSDKGGDIGKGGGSGASAEASKDFGTSVAQMTDTLVTSDNYLGRFTKQIKSQTKVMCNEAPVDGNLKGFIKTAFSMVGSW